MRSSCVGSATTPPLLAKRTKHQLGIDVGPSEDRAFWTAFLRSLVKRGLKGVRLVISDAHVGLKQAISTVLSGATWQASTP